jgi:signal peptidase I
MMRSVSVGACLVVALVAFAVAGVGRGVGTEGEARIVAAQAIGSPAAGIEGLDGVYTTGQGTVIYTFRVDGYAMVPALHSGDEVLVDPEAYAKRAPERGDIVVFDPPVASEKPYIKRVIGVAGDTIEIKQDGYVYVNGVKLEEPYIQGGITECNVRKCEPMTVPEGSVYVLGDNRRNSSDSRIFGTVKIDRIIGKAWFAYDPSSGHAL